MTEKVTMYLAYLALSIGLTVWVGRALSRNGRVFLEDAFDDERLAASVNQLLVVGFYLLNLGYVSVAMRDSADVLNASEVLEQLSGKVGLVLLVLGVVHFFNLYALNRYRRNRLAEAYEPPLPPAAMLAPALVGAQTQGRGAEGQHHSAVRPTAGPDDAWDAPGARDGE